MSAQALTFAGDMGGSLLQYKAAKDAAKDQRNATEKALAFERAKYEDDRRIKAQELAMRTAARRALFERMGIPFPENSASSPLTLGPLSVGGRPISASGWPTRPPVRRPVAAPGGMTPPGVMPQPGGMAPPAVDPALDPEAEAMAMAEWNTWQ